MKIVRNEKGQFIKVTDSPYRFQKGHIPWHRGTKNIRLSNSGSFEKGNIPWNKNEKTGQKVWNKGRKGYRSSPETEFKKGMIPWNKGKPYYQLRGKNHPAWNSGSSFKPYPLGWTNTFKEQIRYRDKYVCQICNVPEIECNSKLCIHHKDLDKNNLNPENLISLCKSCHMKLHWKLKKCVYS